MAPQAAAAAAFAGRRDGGAGGDAAALVVLGRAARGRRHYTLPGEMKRGRGRTGGEKAFVRYEPFESAHEWFQPLSAEQVAEGVKMDMDNVRMSNLTFREYKGHHYLQEEGDEEMRHAKWEDGKMPTVQHPHDHIRKETVERLKNQAFAENPAHEVHHVVDHLQHVPDAEFEKMNEHHKERTKLFHAYYRGGLSFADDQTKHMDEYLFEVEEDGTPKYSKDVLRYHWASNDIVDYWLRGRVHLNTADVGHSSVQIIEDKLSHDEQNNALAARAHFWLTSYAEIKKHMAYLSQYRDVWEPPKGQWIRFETFERFQPSIPTGPQAHDSRVVKVETDLERLGLDELAVAKFKCITDQKKVPGSKIKIVAKMLPLRWQNKQWARETLIKFVKEAQRHEEHMAENREAIANYQAPVLDPEVQALKRDRMRRKEVSRRTKYIVNVKKRKNGVGPYNKGRR